MKQAKETVTVVKIGGKVIDDESHLKKVLAHFAELPGGKVMVHGGGKIATDLATKLNKPQQLIEGRRVTDAETLKILTMVYGGYINKSLVVKLQALGVNALGVCGADGDLILSKKRAPGAIDYGLVGDIIRVNTDRLERWMGEGLSPVVAPLTHDGKGQILNTNADHIAKALAIALSKKYSVNLVYCFEKSGVLMDMDDDSSRIPKITPSIYAQMRSEGKVFAGMIPKLDNAFNAIENGVHQVILGQAVELPRLIQGAAGTRLINE